MRYLQLFLVVFCTLLPSKIFAQQGIKYQAVLLDGQKDAITQKSVAVRFSIVETQTKTICYRETQTAEVIDGVINLIIGNGASSHGKWEEIAWTTKNLSLEVEIDLEQNGEFVAFSVEEFTAVPYALIAKEVVQSVDSVRKIPNVFHLVNQNDTVLTVKENRIGIGTTNPRGDLELGLNKRIHLSSEEWHLSRSGVVCFQAMNSLAKPSLTWYDEHGTPRAAMTLYDRAEVDSVHNREFAIETDDGEGNLIPRFTLPYGRPKAAVNFYNSDVLINGGSFTVGRANTSGAPSRFYGDVYMHRRLGVGNKDWSASGFTNMHSAIELYAQERAAEMLIKTDGDQNASIILDRAGTAWEIVNSGDLHIQQEQNRVMTLTTDGNVGLGTDSPSEKLEVVGNVVSQGSVTAAGGCFALYFEKEGVIAVGDIVGVNSTTGKVRVLQEGDNFIGIVVDRTSAAFIGNGSSEIVNSSDFTLVAIKGLVSPSLSQLKINNGLVQTIIGNHIIGFASSATQIILK